MNQPGQAIFPRNAEVTPIPNVFFSHLLPEISDPAELRVVLHIFFAIRCKTVFPRFVSRGELLADEGLRRGFGAGDAFESALDSALQSVLSRGLVVAVGRRLLGGEDSLFFINDEAGRRSARRVEIGELAVSVAPAQAVADVRPHSLIDLYEANFGPVTTLVAEAIAEAEQIYPAAWLPRAMKLAVAANVRRWSYVVAILERWQNEGIDIDEETGRDPEAERLWQRQLRARNTP